MGLQRRYLVVDDNLAFADNLAEILGDAGAEVDVASAGSEALRYAERTLYDALVSDMEMPTMGGAELIHRVRRVDPWLPAVVLTAGCDADELRAAHRAGLLAVLLKPVPLTRLIELLAAARRGGLVLLVEHDATRLDRWTDALRARGFTAIGARSVIELDTLSDLSPFAAVVDSCVPVADGTAVAHLARCFPGMPTVIDPRDLVDAVERLYRGHLAA